MDLADLRAFVAVSRAGTIAGAAVTLNLTPTPVGRALHRLERELGAALFAYEHHPLALTDAGRQALPQAVEALARVQAIAHLGQTITPRLGATTWAPERFCTTLSETFAPPMPGMSDADIDRAPSRELIRMLAHGDLDLALVHLAPDEDRLLGISTRSLARYRFTFFVAPAHPLADKRDLSLADLRGIPLAIPTAFHRRLALAGILRQLHDAGVGPVLDLAIGDWAALPSLVQSSGAMTLGSRFDDTPMAKTIRQPGLVALDLSEEGPELHLALAWRTLDSLTADSVRTMGVAPSPAEEDLAQLA